MLTKAVLLIPMRDNDGRAFRHTDLARLERQLTTTIGGYTRRNRIRGGWADDGRVYRDESYEYTVGLESFRQVAPLVALVDWALVYFRQEAIYLEIANPIQIM